MASPFFVIRLGAFTVAVLLLSEAVDSTSGWYVLAMLLALMTFWDALSFIAFAIAALVLIGVIDKGQGANIALTLFTGAALLRAIAGWRNPARRWYFSSHRWTVDKVE